MSSQTYTRLALQLVPEAVLLHDPFLHVCIGGVLHAIVQLHIYTDGSAVTTPAGNEASWAFVVLAEGITGQLWILGTCCGAVVTDVHERGYIGADVADNFAAEVSAILWAMIWRAAVPATIPTSFGYDNIAAANLTRDVWISRSDTLLVRLSAAVATVLSWRCPLSWGGT